MDGATGRVGAVAALEGFENPICVARAVMDRTPHVLLAGGGAAAFARAEGLTEISDPAAWFTRAGGKDTTAPPDQLAHGTVGCVARDLQGRLAAGTSTGGVFGKRPGRVGDSPIPGAGVWADQRVAISCTGQGEYFIRLAVAAQVAHRMRWAGEDIGAATRAALGEVAAAGGDGGIIAVDARGEIAMPFLSHGMKRAAVSASGAIVSAAF
jgi:isoaspartyl peptidase/L-asparaginase-like protein (Ntn-hydrolase superfamily)